MPAAAQETAEAQAVVCRFSRGLVAGASSPKGTGDCTPVQPGVGTVADAGPEAKSPATAPVPTASTPSTATTAVRRSLDGVRPEESRV